MRVDFFNSENIEAAWHLLQELLIEQNTEKYFKASYEEFRQSFLTPQLTTLKGLIGYDEANNALALATYCFSYSVYIARPILTFKTFYVRPDHRKQGYGRKILKCLLEDADKENCGYIQWNVYESNESAKSYYKSMMFEPETDLLNFLITPQELRQQLGI